MTKLLEESSWHSLDLEQCIAQLDTSKAGLSKNEARKRLDTVGANILPRKPPTHPIVIFLSQFRSPLIYILAIAAIVSLSVKDYKDAAFIFLVLLLNACIGGYQEWKAEKGARALEKFLKIRALVMRDGEEEEIGAEELVPGDIVLLESGNRVPADLRLLSAQGLEIDESLLSGESLPVHKDSAWLWQGEEEDVPAADRLNLAYAGSIVVRGRARAVVVATGKLSLIGRLALDVVSSEGGHPPLVRRLEAFTRVVALVAVGSAVCLGLIGYFFHGYQAIEMLMFGIALAVSSIPEGLPIAITVALSVAAARMAGKGVIVRRLKAVEGLGSCTLIATDKTGTLTCNELTVKEIRLGNGRCSKVSGEGFAPQGNLAWLDSPSENLAAIDAKGADDLISRLVRVAVLCNEGDLHKRDDNWLWHGDPTDIALLSLGLKTGADRFTLLEEFPLVEEIPFEPERQYSATRHEATGDDGSRLLLSCVKGAPEKVLDMCIFSSSEQPDPDEVAGVEADKEHDKEHLLAMAEQIAANGYRVLALADSLESIESPLALASSDNIESFEPTGLHFLGFVAMIDPLRPGVVEAISSCQNAGITVSMVTGDHPATALAISRELGLASAENQVVTGGELLSLEPGELEKLVEKTRVFARTAPRQKLEIVESAQRAGHVVAVTGDGVNDAPALKAANIGVAMGKSGTDVAREASELVITDDNFSTIVSGIEEGRVAYDNVRKVTYLLVSTGAAEIIILGGALLSGLPLPLLPVQILWLNLVTNGIQDIALAFEPSEGDVLKRKPRDSQERIFDRLMIERTIVGGAVMGIVTLAVFSWMMSKGWSEQESRNAILLLLVLFQNIHIGNCRSETKSGFVLSPLRNPILLLGACIALTVHVAAIYTPFMQALLQTGPVEPIKWPVFFALALSIFVAIEIHKFSWKKRYLNK